MDLLNKVRIQEEVADVAFLSLLAWLITGEAKFGFHNDDGGNFSLGDAAADGFDNRRENQTQTYTAQRGA